MESITRVLRALHERHEFIKHKVHTAWRYPLPRWGQFAMGCFYFSVPIAGGWYVMQWAISKSVEEIGERGEKLQNKQLQGFGNKTVIGGREEKIGAGGKFGGVHLAVSDSSTQEKNKVMLKALFRKERKRRNIDNGQEEDQEQNS